ncbi:MAG: DUF366 family protein [candidate division WOR-3 bacterium]|jgi:hypothetical protein
MKYHFAEGELTYTGEQLRSNFAYDRFGVFGDSIVSFCGACDVKKEWMVDMEDLRAGSEIRSGSMLHFIVEHHDTDLEKNVYRQMILAIIIKDLLNEQLGKAVIRRRHTDLYDGEAKLSVSVATLSPVSALIHFGINISSRNTPVLTRGLEDYGINPRGFADSVMRQYVREIEDTQHARCKVKWVR